MDFDRGRIDGAVVEDDCAGFLNEVSGVERRAGIDGEIPGSREGALDRERVICGDGDATASDASPVIVVGPLTVKVPPSTFRAPCVSCRRSRSRLRQSG